MIEFKNVSKFFGPVKALDDITITYPHGKIIGLLGPNGSGKSTTLKMIAGLNKPDRGELLINNEKVGTNTKKHIAYLPEIDYLYSWMTIGDAIKFYKGFYEDWSDKKCENLLKFLQLEPTMNIKKISKGMRAKAKLLLAFSRTAKIVLLDEPLSGIDILTRDQIIQTILDDYTAGEQTIIISTHEVQEIEGIVDEVVFLKQGNVILKGEAEELRNEKGLSLVELMKEVYHYGDF